jgi:ribosome-associated protein
MTATDDAARERPSKSARKRESQELQELGEELIGLPDSIFDAVELPENLREAILAARRITSHGALLRQRQYIGRLMRTIDAAPIRAVIDQHLTRQRSSGMRFRRVEAWRDRLVSEGASAIPALRAEAPTVEAAEVMQLLAAVQRAHDDQTRRTAARALFRYLDGRFPA